MATLVVVTQDPELTRHVEGALRDLPGESISCAVCGPEQQDLLDLRPDVVMADMRGEVAAAFATRFSGEVTSADIPLIAVTARGASADVVTDLELGANDVIAADLCAAELRARVTAQLRLKGRIDQLKAEAVVDELTGIYNRRFLDSQLVAKLGEAWRYHHPFTFMILDIDHFKRVNDTYGHHFGDIVLSGIGGMMRGMVRKEDIVARYGGEEFALLLPHTDQRGAAVLGERVRAAAERYVCNHDGQEVSVTLSIGVATYPTDAAESVEELVRKADERLYQAKDDGRNRVICG